MIKITKATYLRDKIIDLQFSDGTRGEYDVGPLLERQTTMTAPLQTPEGFRRFFIELGALCWPNGFELSPGSIHKKLQQSRQLKVG